MGLRFIAGNRWSLTRGNGCGILGTIDLGRRFAGRPRGILMARTGITYDEVARTAATLLAHGENPTIQRVRELLGSGSNTTISNHLRHWHETHQEELGPALPSSLPESLMPALEAFWQIAVEHARELFNQERAASERQVATAREAQAAAEQENNRLAGERDRLQRELDRTSRELAERSEQLTAERNGRQQTVGDLRATTERCTGLEQALGEARDALAAAEQRQRDERTALAARYQAQLTDERERAEAAANRLRQRLDEERQQARAERERLLANLAETRKQCDSELAAREHGWREQQQALQRTLAKERDQHNAAGREAAELRGRLTQQGAGLAALETALERGRERELALGRDNERLQLSLRQLETESNRLRQELQQARHRESPESSGPAPRPAPPDRSDGAADQS